MTDETTNTHSEDDGEESTADLKQRVKEYALAAIAWLRVQLAQSAEEIVPQLRGAVSGVSIPRRAMKPLAVAGVLLFGAIALGPAAPIGSDPSPTVETEEPVIGETYEPPEDGEYRRVVESAVSSTLASDDADPPDPPSEVRTSAGSQTMSVETTVVDGEPAIVLSDDQTHDGRWVSIETAWFEDAVGEVPDAAYIDHEDDGEYAIPTEVRGGQAAFFVRGFSTNTVTFDGEVVLSGADAGDGTEYEYGLNSTDGIEDFTANVTGVKTTKNASISRKTSLYSTTATVGGNQDPDSASVSFTGERTESDVSKTGTLKDGTKDVTASVDGNTDPKGESIQLTATEYSQSEYDSSDKKVDVMKDESEDFYGEYATFTYPNPPEILTQVEIYVGNDGDYTTDSDIAVSVDGTQVHVEEEHGGGTIYASAGDMDLTGKDSVTVKIEPDGLTQSGWEPYIYVDTTAPTGYSWDASHKSYVGGSEETVNSELEGHDKEATVDHPSGTDTIDFTSGTDQTVSTDFELGDNTVSLTGSSDTVSYSVDWTEVTRTDSPSVSFGGETVSHTGILDNGETVTENISLSNGEKDLTFDTSFGEAHFTTSWTEKSLTEDPAISVNGDKTSHTGTLEDGETVSLDANVSWLQEGTNRVSVSTTSPTNGPASLVGLDYSHGAETTTSATVEETTWIQTTNASNTWPSARSNATATLLMNDRVVDVRNVEVRYNGTTWESVAESEYTLNGTDLTVQLGDVAKGSTTEVRATGLKIRVEDGEITVLDPTTSSDTLNTRVQVDDAGSDFAISVDETVFGDRVHYAENATWGETTGDTTITADGGQTVTLPDATPGAEATVRTWPIEVAVAQDQLTVGELAGDRSEPGLAVEGDGLAEVEYTFADAADKPYILWSETNEIPRDDGFSSSSGPITLVDDNSEEALIFQVDDGSGSGSGSGSSAGGGGPGMMDPAGSGGVLGQLQGLVLSGQTLLIGVALLGGLAVIGRRTGVITESRTDAATNAASSAAGTVGGLVERLLANEVIFGVLILGGAAWVLMSGILSEQATLIVSIGAVPVALFLVLQQFDAFDFRVWVGATALVGVLGLQAIAPELGETIADETGVILVVGVIALGWRALSAWRAAANTPDTVTNLEVTAQEDDDGD